MSIVITTTKWDTLVGTDIPAATKREETVRAKFWNAPDHHGATIHRICNEPNSAWRIVDDIVSKSTQKGKTGLQFQCERVDQKKSLMKTSAKSESRSARS